MCPARSSTLVLAAALLLDLAVPGAASALSIRYAFTGTIYGVDPALASAVGIGQAVSVVAVIDAATAPNPSGSSTSGYAGAAVSARFGSLAAVADPLSSGIGVTDDHRKGGDALQISGTGLGAMPAVGPFVATNIDLFLADLTGAVFSSQALPTALSLDDFTTDVASLRFRDPGSMNTAGISADLTSVSVSVSVVPEPRVGLLAAALPVALALHVRRRQPASPTLRAPARACGPFPGALDVP